MKPEAPAAVMHLLVAAVVLLLGGCVVPLPVKESNRALEGQRENLGGQTPAFIVEGRTTREDVLLTLGEPDGRSAGDYWFIYATGRSLGGVSLLAIIPAPSHGAVGEIATRQTLVWRELTLHFDEQGIVRKADFIEQTDQRIHWLPGNRGPLPPAPRAVPIPQASPATLAHRDAMRSFVPAEPGERVLEGFVAAACQVGGQWHDALALVTDRAVYCWIPAQTGGDARSFLLHWKAGEIDAPDWAAAEAAPDRPAVQLRHRDGATALFAFYSFEGSDPTFDRARALLFLESLRLLRTAASR